MDQPRTVIIGLDALSFDYLDRFTLPVIDSLRSRGVEADLESTFPPWTGSAWPSVYTGVEPDHHSVYSFFDFHKTYPDEATVISRENVRSPAIWNYLDARDIRSTVLNVPVTHPAESIQGTIVPGYLAPEDAAGSPVGIRDKLSNELGERYQIYADNEDTNDAISVSDLVSLIDHRRRAAQLLLESTEWEFAFLQVQKTDTVFHKYNDESAFRRVYNAADEFVETVLQTVPDGTNVILCSDHGIGPTNGYNIYVNEVLRQNGFVETCTDSRTPTLGESKGELGLGSTDEAAESTASGSTATKLISVAESALRHAGLTPGDAYRLVKRIGAEPVVSRVLPEGTGAEIGESVDWHHSQAYCRSGPELGVRINLQGRDPDGVVPPAEYERVQNAIIEALVSLQTPDGKPAFEWVKPRDAVYDGPFAEDACDVLFMPHEMNNLVATNLLGSTFVPIDKHNHKRTGMFIGAGPGFNDAAHDQIDFLSVTDVAPIAMALLDQPVPKRMQGTVPSALTDSRQGRHEYQVTYGGQRANSEEDEHDAVIDRLENLGYR